MPVGHSASCSHLPFPAVLLTYRPQHVCFFVDSNDSRWCSMTPKTNHILKKEFLTCKPYYKKIDIFLLCCLSSLHICSDLDGEIFFWKFRGFTSSMSNNNDIHQLLFSLWLQRHYNANFKIYKIKNFESKSVSRTLLKKETLTKKGCVVRTRRKEMWRA